ncbi:MAG: dipeptidyl-peptidase 5 [Acidimicrobiales bacterium]
MTSETAFGSWPSPITAELVVAGAVGLGDCRIGDDDVWWAESRPEQAGRIAVVRHRPGGGTVEAFGEEFSARSRVHEYGGGAWWLHDDTLFFTNATDQRLYRVDPDTEPGSFASPIALTPDPAVLMADRYADGVLTVDGRWVICVRERHDGPVVSNELVAIEAQAGGEPLIVVSGPDFVAAPRVSPDGLRLCWLQWNDPDMPWDGTELWMADLTSNHTCEVAAARRIAGSRTESITQPEWHADGSLWFVSDRTDWWNLYRIGADSLPRGAGASTGPQTGDPEPTPIGVIRGDIGVPAWVFAQSRYAFLPDGRVAVAYTADGVDHLAVISTPVRPDTPDHPGEHLVVDLPTPFTTLSSLRTYGHGLAMIAGAPTAEPVVAVADLPPHGDATVGVLWAPRDLGLDPAWFSVPVPLDVPTTDGAVTHALYYPPTHPAAHGPSDELPPLVVMIHGGPTSAARPQLSLALQFWTSRGFAVADVNYRGSSGYGRAYRGLLTGQWGIADVEDCVAVAEHLVAEGSVDPDRLAIRGGSAGGFTALCALTFHDRFGAGASLYGVADLEALARDTHKFEARYLDSLVGPYPAERERYLERSPIHHVDRLDRPVIVLQGLEDEVVPPAQSEMIVDALRAKGVPVAYLAFEGEQHGFRQAPNIRRALEAELYFYGRVFGFEPWDPIDPVPIDNL